MDHVVWARGQYNHSDAPRGGGVGSPVRSPWEGQIITKLDLTAGKQSTQRRPDVFGKVGSGWFRRGATTTRTGGGGGALEVGVG